jgi:hypothetical protein
MYRTALCVSLAGLLILSLHRAVEEEIESYLLVPSGIRTWLHQSAWDWFSGEYVLGICVLLLYVPERHTRSSGWVRARRHVGSLACVVVAIVWLLNAGFYYALVHPAFPWIYQPGRQIRLAVMESAITFDTWTSALWWTFVLFGCLDALRRVGARMRLWAAGAFGISVMLLELLALVQSVSVGVQGGLADLEGTSALTYLPVVGWRVNELATFLGVRQGWSQETSSPELVDIVAFAQFSVILVALASVLIASVCREPTNGAVFPQAS